VGRITTRSGELRVIERPFLVQSIGGIVNVGGTMVAHWATEVIEAIEREVAAGGGPRGAAELLAGLRSAGDAPLAQALAEGRLAGAPPGGVAVDGPHADVVRAALGPGLRLVWGAAEDRPAVLAAAVEALVARGRRVLLVAPTEATVPSGIGTDVGPAPGSGEVGEALTVVTAQLRELDAEAAQLAELRAELAGFDESAYRAAAARVAGDGDLDELAARLTDAEVAANAVRRAAVAAATDLQEALAASVALNPLRDALEHTRTALAGIAAVDQRHRDLQVEYAGLAGQEAPSGWGARSRHRHAVDAADAELRRFADAATAGRRRWLDLQLQAREVIGDRSQDDVDAADRRVAEAEAAVAAADEEYRRSRDLLAELRAALAAAQERGRPSEADRELVADADARGLPARQAQLAELESRRERSAERRRTVAAEQRRLAQRAEVLRANAEVRAVRGARVVATTLAKARSNPVLARAAFDVVLVDGADTAPLAEVLLALCRATTTAVLFGGTAGGGFAHLGITSPADAAAHDGGVVLVAVPEQRPAEPVPAPS
jgi:hypothetical protein